MYFFFHIFLHFVEVTGPLSLDENKLCINEWTVFLCFSSFITSVSTHAKTDNKSRSSSSLSSGSESQCKRVTGGSKGQRKTFIFKLLLGAWIYSLECTLKAMKSHGFSLVFIFSWGSLPVPLFDRSKTYSKVIIKESTSWRVHHRVLQHVCNYLS